ncbi:MAG TPA: hypothetical protein P5232_03490 [Candidatus Moranbacteria bacterium]|nr:hypothetical protein [Candidatus Moranbacteria bacterium]
MSSDSDLNNGKNHKKEYIWPTSPEYFEQDDVEGVVRRMRQSFGKVNGLSIMVNYPGMVIKSGVE